MFQNYLITSLRNFRKNLFYLGINVISIAVAVAICVIAYFNFHYNHSYNTHFKNANGIYKIHGERIGAATVGATQASIVPLMKEAGFEAMRYHAKHIQIRNESGIGNQLFQEKAGFIDPTFLNHFNFSDVQGRQVRLEKNSYEMAISQNMAIRLFGKKNAVGEVVQLVTDDHQEISFKVSHVLVKTPHNSSFHFDLLISIHHYFKIYGISENDAESLVNASFLRLEKEDLPKAVKELEVLLSRKTDLHDGIDISSYRLDNLLKWPAIEKDLFERAFPGHLHPASVLGILSSAFAILLLACFNFVNTSMAVAGRRLKEIGLRKVLGGNRKQIITQFMVENLLMIFLGMILSLIFLIVLIPIYNGLYQFELIQPDQVPVSSYVILAIFLLITVTLMAGAYPAFYLSGLSSLHIFRNKSYLSGRNLLSKVLLTFQFVLCFYNLFSLLVFIDNAQYQDSLDRGYLAREIINIPLKEARQFTILQQATENLPGVVTTSGSQGLVGFSVGKQSIDYEGTAYYNDFLKVGPNYLQAIGVDLIKGDWFIDNNSQQKNGIVINSMLERQVGKDLLGEVIFVDNQHLKVRGVVADFNTTSIMLQNKIKPLIISLATEKEFNYLNIQVKQENIESVNGAIEKLWYELFPNELYGGFYQEKVMDPVDRTNEITISINVFIAVISLMISALGLYTLISLVILRRIKEIGVRKVLGASIGSIANLLGKEFYLILGIASILGLTMGYMVINNLLDIIFAYHITLGWQHFISPIIAIGVIVISSVGYKIYITAKMNPNEQLRVE